MTDTDNESQNDAALAADDADYAEAVALADKAYANYIAADDAAKEAVV